jgi:YD repeat-containing protein
LQAYNKGNGAWSLTYDTLNRLTSATDPDNVTTRTCYYPNGQIQATQTATQYALDGNAPCGAHSVSYGYDANGNEISETHHFGNIAATTNKWYDGGDRLIEIEEPQDPNDAYQFSWKTRYIYDLSENGSAGPRPSVAGQSLTGYGNLVKTQECLATPSVTIPGSFSSCSFTDTKAQAFDALDRLSSKYSYSGQSLYTETLTYDATGTSIGKLSRDCTGSVPCKSYEYDPDGSTSSIVYNDPNTPNLAYTYDSDGRVASAQSGQFGAQTYTYNADGNMASSVEPAGLPAHATLAYHYYADDSPASLDVQSTAFNQNQVFRYSYRPDGKVEQQAVETDSLPQGSTTVGFGYTAAGRTANLTYSGAGRPIAAPSFTYDAYGMESSVSLGPTVGMSNYSRDAEGGLTGYTSTGAATSVALNYSRRGELVSTKIGAAIQSQAVVANGIPIALATNPNSGYTNATLDARMGALTSQYNVPPATFNGRSPCAKDYSGTSCASENYTYDGTGRLTSTLAATYKLDDTKQIDETDTTTTNVYDAENHMTDTKINTSDLSGGLSRNREDSYVWGPNGHPDQIGFSGFTVGSGGPYYETLHWDGGRLLFVTDPTGRIVDLKIGTLGDVTFADTGYTGATFYERMPSGSIGVCYNAAAVVGTLGQSSYRSTNNCIGTNVPTFTYLFTTCCGSAGGQVPVYAGPDGIWDGVNTIQGVRMFNSDSNSWATPDAYAGEVNDPASQRQYVWNRGNPISYEDPSGYTVVIGDKHLKHVIQDMASRSKVFAKMLKELQGKKAGTFVVTPLTNTQDGVFRANEGKGGSIGIGTRQSHGGTMDTAAHEFGHAFDSIDRARFNVDVRTGVPANAFRDEPATQEEVNAYSIEHRVDLELGNARNWVGPDWGPLGQNHVMDWASFNAQYHPNTTPWVLQSKRNMIANAQTAIIHRFDNDIERAMLSPCKRFNDFLTDAPLIYLAKAERHNGSLLIVLHIDGFFPAGTPHVNPVHTGRLYLQLDDQPGIFIYRFGISNAPNVFMYEFKNGRRHRLIYSLVGTRGSLAYGQYCF